MKKTDKEIEKFIQQYHDFLSAANIDVAHSLISGDWFIYQHNKHYGYYEYFIRFTTLAQLIDIILEEMQFELYCASAQETSSPPCEKESFAEQITHFHKLRSTLV